MIDCKNSYDLDEIPHRMMEDKVSTRNCESCNNLVIEGGIITCKYLLENQYKIHDKINSK